MRGEDSEQGGGRSPVTQPRRCYKGSSCVQGRTSSCCCSWGKTQAACVELTRGSSKTRWPQPRGCFHLSLLCARPWGPGDAVGGGPHRSDEDAAPGQSPVKEVVMTTAAPTLGCRRTEKLGPHGGAGDQRRFGPGGWRALSGEQAAGGSWVDLEAVCRAVRGVEASRQGEHTWVPSGSQLRFAWWSDRSCSGSRGLALRLWAKILRPWSRPQGGLKISGWATHLLPDGC